MDLRGFIDERRPAWRRLDELLGKADRTRFRLTAPEAHELGALYRRASADLCRAQARTANAEVLRYLNDLVARAYSQIYSGRRFRWLDIWEFVARGFPAAARRHAGLIGVAAALCLLGFAFGFVAAALDDDARHFLVPEQIAATVEHLDEVIANHQVRSLDTGEASLVSSTIMTNNIRVSFGAFALGITFGLGSAVLMFYNGVIVGVLASYFHKAGHAQHFWSLILPHGVIELAAIFVAGGAGLLLARGLIAPGDLTRAQALRRNGADAVRLVMGIVPMLVVAGLIEGFVTPQSEVPAEAKIAFGALTGLAMAVYFAPREALSRLRRAISGEASSGASSGQGMRGA